MDVKSVVDPRLCPLCGRVNQCAIELQRSTGVVQSPCWCNQVSFNAALLARVPAPARGQACLCAACAGLQARGETP